MQRIRAKDVARLVHDAMRTHPEWYKLKLPELAKWHEIEFDDSSIIKSHIKQTIYCGLFWRVFELYPTTRILPEHFVGNVIGDGSLTASTHTALCSRIFKSIVYDNDLWAPEPKEPVLKEIYQAISDAQVALSKLTPRNVTSADYLDFLEIAKDPVVAGMKEEAFKDPRRIKATYDGVIKLIKEEPRLHENGLSKAVRCGMVKPNQVVQCTVFRGIPSEVDGAIYKRPIWSNYTLGNTRLFDFAADSRTAAKSHFYSDSSLKQAEYMSRKFRLFANPVERIAWEDCGNTDYVPWVVKPPVKDSAGAETYRGDLPNLIGKSYHIDGETEGETRFIEGNEKELIGRKIWIRTVLTCKTRNPHMRCASCIGLLSQNISRFANIGHLGSITSCKPVTQNILSIKHVNTSAQALKVLLGEAERKYFNSGPSGTGFYVNQNLIQTGAKMSVSKKAAVGLTDVTIVEDLESVSLSRISNVDKVKISTVNNGREFGAILRLTQKLKNPVFSWEFLEYAKEHGWDIDSANNFVFDLSKWDHTKPIMTMPSMEESFSDLATQVESLVRSSQDRKRERNKIDAPMRLLQELFDLMNSMLSVNILSMELIVYSLMIKSYRDSSLAGHSKDAVLGIGSALTKLRSISSAMFFEGQSGTITNPASYISGKRPDSPLDVFFDPKAVVEEYRRRGYG